MVEDVTRTLASFASQLTYDRIPQSAREFTKHLLLDALACALAGYDGEDTPKMIRFASALGQSQESSIIIGAQRHSKSANSSQGLYVRRPDEAKALLVEGNLKLTNDIKDWFDRNILDIPSSAMREVSIQHTDGDELKISKKNRESPEFELENYTEQKKSVFKIL